VSGIASSVSSGTAARSTAAGRFRSPPLAMGRFFPLPTSPT